MQLEKGKINSLLLKRVLGPHNVSVDEDLREAATQVENWIRSCLNKFAIGGKEAEGFGKV
ncbi:hypothetical protein F2Q69_00063569 [Brassica cretica]|uniref:Uncharacterized protein n=1 Tax=Brassica cretica TaxID=69181 RepID=A0A8S9RL13_BRACR|nr:hypothetical protein F2Q69_00063569 [Brassica cretica]